MVERCKARQQGDSGYVPPDRWPVDRDAQWVRDKLMTQPTLEVEPESREVVPLPDECPKDGILYTGD